MTEISVVDDTTTGVDIYTLPKRDKEDLFDRLITLDGKKPENLNQRHAFMHLFAQSPRQAPEKLPDALLIRDIIANPLRYDRIVAFPIITSVKKSTFVATGGAIKIFRPVLGKKVLPSASHVQAAQSSAVEVSFDRPTRCINIDGGRARAVMIAPGEIARVIGMRLAPICATPYVDRTAMYSDDAVDPTLSCSFFKKFTINGLEVAAPYRDIYVQEDLYFAVARYIYETYTNALRLSPLVLRSIDFVSRSLSDGPRKYVPATMGNAKRDNATDTIARCIARNTLVVGDAPAAADVVQTENELSDNAFFQYVRDNFGEVSLINEQANAGTLQLYGLLSAYMRYTSHGMDDDVVRDIADRQLRHHRNGRVETEASKEQFRERTKLSIYMRILQRFLSSKRFELLKHHVNSDALLGALNKSEKEKLLLEYTIEKKYIESVINNSCPHVTLYSRLRRTSGSKQEVLRRLSEFYDARYPRNKLIECKKCKYNIMCPHIVETIENERGSLADMRNALKKYVADDLSANGSQFCRICGEVVFSRMDFEEDLRPVSEYDDALRSVIWTEVALIVRRMSFDHAVDTTRLITSVRDSIYPAVSIIDVDLSRNQSHTASEIGYRKSLYISILAMAKLTQLVHEKKTMQLPGSTTKTSSRSNIRQLFETGASYISSTHNIAIAAIGGMTRDTIQEKIRLSYEHLGSELVEVETVKGETIEDLKNTVMLDPTYKWIMRRDRDNRQSKRFDTAFGLNIDAIKKLRAGEYLYRVAKISPPGKSFADRVFSFWMVTALGNEPKMFYSNPDSPSLLLTPAYIEWMRQSSALVDEEKKIQAKSRAVGLNWTGSRMNGKKGVQHVDIKLGEIYDEDGNAHRFNRFVIGAKEYSREELHALLTSGRAATVFGGKLTVTDRICGTCGVKESLMKKLDEDKIMRSLENRTRIGGFFKFYEKRCPVAGVHEWDNTGFVCKKCGLNISSDSKVSRLNYYREHKDTYVEQRKIGHVKQRKPAPPVDYSVPNPNWKENFQYIVDVAKLAKVDIREIQYIGSYEGVNHEDIIKGKYTPTVTEDRTNTRVWALHGIVVSLITSFERLRNYTKIRERDFDLETIIEGYNRSQLAKLPSIENGFHDLFTYFYRNEDPERVITMCIQEWCHRLMLILEIDDVNKSSEVREKFVHHHIAETLRLQTLLTKRDPFNWAIVFGNKTAILESLPNEEQNEEESGKSKDDPFSLEAYDVEGEINLNMGDD